jgi:hypothetical protein
VTMFGRDKAKGINAYGFAEKTLVEESMKKFKRDGNTNKPQGAASDVIKIQEHYRGERPASWGRADAARVRGDGIEESEAHG